MRNLQYIAAEGMVFDDQHYLNVFLEKHLLPWRHILLPEDEYEYQLLNTCAEYKGLSVAAVNRSVMSTYEFWKKRREPTGRFPGHAQRSTAKLPFSSPSRFCLKFAFVSLNFGYEV